MDNYNTFVNWCNDNGAKISDLLLETYKNNERGIHAINGIRKSKTIIEIPERLIIHDGMGKETEYGQMIKKHEMKFKNLKIIYVMLFILETYKTDCFYEPYYDILPKNTDNFPIFWKKEDIVLMSGSNISSNMKFYSLFSNLGRWLDYHSLDWN